MLEAILLSLGRLEVSFSTRGTSNLQRSRLSFYFMYTSSVTTPLAWCPQSVSDAAKSVPDKVVSPDT